MADQITRTNIRLMSGVPFNVDYKHTRWFDTLAQQQTYMSAKPVVYSTGEANFQRIEGRYYFKCPEHIERLEDVNYIRFNNKNADGTTNSKIYYGFITHLEYMNKGNTHVYFELDVLQTFMFDMDFKPSFISREHMRRYHADTGRPIEHTVDEGLNYGTEYHTKGGIQVRNRKDVRFFVVISKEALHETDGHVSPSYIVNPQPLFYYIIPFTPNGKACQIGLNTQSDTLRVTDPHIIIDAIYRLPDTVNNVVSMYVTDDIGMKIDDVVDADDANYDDIVILRNVAGKHQLEEATIADGSEMAGYAVWVKKISEFETNEFLIDSNYWNSLYGINNDKPKEAKILMSPYHWIEIHDYRGNIVKARPEHIWGTDMIIQRKGSLGLSNKVSYNIKNYNLDNEGNVYGDQMENEYALIDNNPQDVTVKNDHLAAFIQGNKNQLVHQQNQAILSGIFSSASSGVGVAGATTKAGVAGALVGGAQGLAGSAMVIQGQQAKKNDINNIPASISKMGNNTAYDIGHGYFGCFVVYKGIKGEYERTISDYFTMFGYKSNQLKRPNFHTREHFNYVETVDCVITGNIHNKYLAQLKEVFNKGITLWHTDAIGNYALSNQEVE